MDEKEKGVYMGSGGFRVDRSRMLEQLARFGFEYENYAVAALVRFAVLSGASRFRITGLAPDSFWKSYDGLQIEFDGKPIDEASLRNPYDCLLADAPDRRRLTQLARALLTLGRGKPNELTVTSGPAGARFELSVRSVTDDSIRAVKGSGPTVLRVAWEGVASRGAPEGIGELVSEKMRYAPIPIELKRVWSGYGDQRSRQDSTFLPDKTLSESSDSFDAGGLRGRVELPERIAPTTGRIALCWAGVQADVAQEAAFLPVPVDGFLDYDGFNLDLSAGAVVRDEAFAAGVAALSRRAIALAVRTAREQAKVMTQAGELLRSSAAARETWTNTLDGELERAPNEGESPLPYGAAVRTRWLRYCALNAASLATPELAAALQAAPLFFSTALEPLSLERLRAIQESRGKIPASTLVDAFGSKAEPTLWLSSTRDAPLLPKSFLLKRLG